MDNISLTDEAKESLTGIKNVNKRKEIHDIAVRLSESQNVKSITASMVLAIQEELEDGDCNRNNNLKIEKCIQTEDFHVKIRTDAQWMIACNDAKIIVHSYDSKQIETFFSL